MSADQAQNVSAAPAPTCMASVNRIAKLPVVESTIQTATSIYEKVRDYNSVTNWTLSTAENTVYKAVEVGKPYATPVIKNFEGPIKKVDDVLCTGLDYVESKVPAVKLPPQEIYQSTKGYVEGHVTPAVESARAYAQPAMDTARAYAEPAVKTARDLVEPAVEKMRSVVDPVMEPLVENVRQRVDEYLHGSQHAEHAESEHSSEHHDGHDSDANISSSSSIECADCQEALRDANHQE